MYLLSVSSEIAIVIVHYSSTRLTPHDPEVRTREGAVERVVADLVPLDPQQCLSKRTGGEAKGPRRALAIFFGRTRGLLRVL